MRRISASFTLVVLLLLGLIVTGAVSGSGRAQEATPTDEEFELPEGVSFEGIAFGFLPADMEPPAQISMFRLIFEPGSGFGPEDGVGDPTTALVYIESGELTFTVDAPIQVFRFPGEGTPFPEELEEIPAGTEFTMTAGDSAVFPPNVPGDVINNGSETAVVLIAELAPEGAVDEESDGMDGTPET